jgi:hypothetical protein
MTSTVPSRRCRTHAWLPALVAAVLLSSIACRRSTLPAALSDQEFWTLIETLSEPGGSFELSENLVSNERRFAESARWLRSTGGVYIGVGPEQNFSYIARLRPAMAFIVDIRSENRSLHLLYKALFELSNDRPEFVSRLFSRPRPAGLTSSASVDEIFRSYDAVAPSRDEFTRNAHLIRERLLTTRRLPLSASDLEAIERALEAFYADGPKIQFWGSRSVDTDTVRPSYRELMTATDFAGRQRSFLADDGGFRFIKDLHSRNRIVPIVGDFGGPTALRRVGDYVRSHHDLIHAFYGSNVSVYLTRAQTSAFCRNLISLPVTPRTVFIDNDGVRPLSTRLQSCPTGGQ